MRPATTLPPQEDVSFLRAINKGELGSIVGRHSPGISGGVSQTLTWTPRLIHCICELRTRDQPCTPCRHFATQDTSRIRIGQQSAVGRDCRDTDRVLRIIVRDLPWADEGICSGACCLGTVLCMPWAPKLIAKTNAMVAPASSTLKRHWSKMGHRCGKCTVSAGCGASPGEAGRTCSSSRLYPTPVALASTGLG